MNCFKCSEPLKTGAKFCNECGAKQQLSCPSCGLALQSGETVCAQCQATQQAMTESQEVASTDLLFSQESGQPPVQGNGMMNHGVATPMETLEMPTNPLPSHTPPSSMSHQFDFTQIPQQSAPIPQQSAPVSPQSAPVPQQPVMTQPEPSSHHPQTQQSQPSYQPQVPQMQQMESREKAPLHVNKFAAEAQQYHEEMHKGEENPFVQGDMPAESTHLPPTAHIPYHPTVEHVPMPEANLEATPPPMEHMEPQATAYPVAHPQYPTTQGVSRGIVKDACTEGDAKNRGLSFERMELGYRITGFNGRNNSPNIPGIIEGVPVFEVGREAFEGKGVESVTIPDGIVEIGDWSFTDNVITKLDLPDSIQYIGLCAFKGNRINTVSIPRSLKKVDKEAFECNKLTHINLPQMLGYIGQSAFSYNNLTNVVIPGSVTYIGNHAFSYNQISSLIISPGVSFLGQDAFAYNQLSSVSVPYGVTEISDAAFYMNKLTKIIIPSSVHTIGANAFRSNQLTNVGIPGSVMNIHPNAFDKWVEIIKI